MGFVFSKKGETAGCLDGAVGGYIDASHKLVHERHVLDEIVWRSRERIEEMVHIGVDERGCLQTGIVRLTSNRGIFLLRAYEASSAPRKSCLLVLVKPKQK